MELKLKILVAIFASFLCLSSPSYSADVTMDAKANIIASRIDEIPVSVVGGASGMETIIDLFALLEAGDIPDISATYLTKAAIGAAYDSSGELDALFAAKANTGRKLDDFGTPDDNTDLNATTTYHGLSPKLSGTVTEFYNGIGGWTTPPGSGDLSAVDIDSEAELESVSNTQLATEAEAAGYVSTHAGEADPHTVYLTKAAIGTAYDSESEFNALFSAKLTVADIDDVAVNAEVAAPISSNWAYDHINDADQHTEYLKESDIGAAYDTSGELDALFAAKADLVSPSFTTPALGVASATSVAVDTEIYDATDWNDDLTVPTKDAVRDKIQSLAAGHDEVTIGTANGLSLSTQQISLAAATNATPGAATAAQITALEAIDTEAELEALLELQDLQGAVTDGQVPTTITIDLAALASTVTVIDSTANPAYIAMFDAATGSLAIKTDAGITYNATTGTLSATGFSGPLTGNVTGNVSGTSLTVTQAAQAAITSLGTLTSLTVDNLTINGNTINADSGAVNITPAVGSAIVLDGAISIDAGVVTGATSITSTAFVGNVTGNVSGTAATVTGATQSAITTAANLVTVGAITSGSWNLADSVTALSVHTGTTSLDEATGATDSGAYIIGVFDEFTYSASTNVQAVLNDLDAAIASLGGTMTTIKENNVQVGGADIVTLDFLGADFDLAETPDTEVQVVIAAAIMRDAEWTSGTTSAEGKLELATNAETVTGTDTSRATTPAGVAAAIAGLAPTNITPVDAAEAATTYYPVLVDGLTGSQATETESDLTYNPATKVLTTGETTAGNLSINDSNGEDFDIDVDGDAATISMTGTGTMLFDSPTVVTDGLGMDYLAYSTTPIDLTAVTSCSFTYMTSSAAAAHVELDLMADAMCNGVSTRGKRFRFIGKDETYTLYVDPNGTDIFFTTTACTAGGRLIIEPGEWADVMGISSNIWLVTASHSGVTCE